jgi:hypothetical protein
VAGLTTHLEAWSGVLCLRIGAVCLVKIAGYFLILYERLMEQKEGGTEDKVFIAFSLVFFLLCVTVSRSKVLLADSCILLA